MQVICGSSLGNASVGLGVRNKPYPNSGDGKRCCPSPFTPWGYFIFPNGTSSMNTGQMGPNRSTGEQALWNKPFAVESFYKTCTKRRRVQVQLALGLWHLNSLVVPLLFISCSWKARPRFQLSSGHSYFPLWDKRHWIREPHTLGAAYHRGHPERGAPVWQMLLYHSPWNQIHPKLTFQASTFQN